ncbi:circularly permuted 1,3-beta-glucanase [Schizosaccharomyces osmophilus]|uniref:glucan endo-1,3-beta-D-glucosidase n=1 Tax=Schizosaccharomyces osmophilus TaxID=2545709 RepID=A0AAE9WB92_9SCHI|nr:circularly permuted 1,3-beta-glucanase [Schizosaccharomyces osmophilus]WBW72778.1 circularly permuted 1,3-beta-glucanase [Schizosaccharomyces osmophilus]
MFAKSLLSSFCFLAVAVLQVSADGCSQDNGYYYCNQASEVEFKGVGFSSSYNKVTSMNPESCECTSTPQSFGGALAPFDEELSFHFRGPVQLKRFAVYYPDSDNALSSLKKRSNHNHKKAVANEGGALKKRDDPAEITSTVYETILRTAYINADGSPATSAPEAFPASTVTGNGPAPTSSSSSSSSLGSNGLSISAPNEIGKGLAASSFVTSSTSAPPTSASSASSAPTSSPSSSGSSDWVRSSYYDSESSTSDNIVFMNNMGGTAGSGVWSYCFGNSISYAAANGVDGASSPQVLADTMLKSDKEVSIWSANKCDGDDCGYYLSGIPAYHGFSGTKVVLMEFNMPHDDSTNFINDMPAIWALNAQVPRTLQYGKRECSCWDSGCGEFDIFEVLNAGNEKMVSTIHSKQGSQNGAGGGGGSSDYFTRPTGSTMIGAVVFDTSSSAVYVIDVTKNGVNFDQTYSASDVAGWLKSGSTVVQLS